MVSQQNSAAAQPLTLHDGEAFLRLPLDERRRRLAEQAERMAESYNETASQNERSEWQAD